MQLPEFKAMVEAGESPALQSWARSHVINDAFAPTKEELAKAREIVKAFENAQRRGLSVVSLGSKMIDPPVVKRA